MSKPFLLIQLRPEDITANNEMLKIKHYGGIADTELIRIRVEQNGLPAIAVNDFSGIIVGGSPFDVSTPESDKSAIQKKIEVGFSRLFDQLLERDFPFLGCCSGNGLLGNYLGTSVSRKYGEPVGGTDITLT